MRLALVLVWLLPFLSWVIASPVRFSPRSPHALVHRSIPDDLVRLTNGQRLARGYPLKKPANLYKPNRVKTARDSKVSAGVKYQRYLQCRNAAGTVVGYIGSSRGSYGAGSASVWSFTGYDNSDAVISTGSSRSVEYLYLTSTGGLSTTSFAQGSGTSIWNWGSPTSGVTVAASSSKGVKSAYRIYKLNSGSTVYLQPVNSMSGPGSQYTEITLSWVTSAA